MTVRESTISRNKTTAKLKLKTFVGIALLLVLVVLQVCYQFNYTFNHSKIKSKTAAGVYEDINDLIDYTNTDTIKLPKFTNNHLKESYAYGLQINQSFAMEDYKLYTNQFPISNNLSSLKTYKQHIIETFNQNLNKPEICEDSSYRSTIKASQDQILTTDMSKLVQILSRTIYNQVLELPATTNIKDPKFIEYVSKKWFVFGGSSVWLESYGVHFMISRVVFSVDDRKDRPKMSFLYAQVYDSNWVELTDFEMSVPFNDEGEYKKIKYPRFLPVEFPWTNIGRYYGPEDSRILVRKNSDGFEEPLIIFNMRRKEIDLKRAMHAYFPFSNKLIMFQAADHPVLKQQKNWSCFISKSQQDPNSIEFNNISFIYSIDPLDILDCNLITGQCNFIHENNPHITIDSKKSGPMRGGTSLVPIPNSAYLPIPSNREIWIAFPRAHVKKCGCGTDMYRPNLMIFIQDTDEKSGERYHRVESISRFVDFGIDVPSWDLNNMGKSEKCDGKSVLIPNSISYWKIKDIEINGKNYNAKQIETTTESEMNGEIQKIWANNKLSKFGSVIKFNDYLGVMVSGADKDNRIVHINGLLNYIKEIPSLFDHKQTLQQIYDYEYFQSKDGRQRFNVVDCSLDASRDYCFEYGKVYNNAEEIDISALPS